MCMGDITSTTSIRPIKPERHPKGKIMKVKLNAFLTAMLVSVVCCILSGCGTSSLGDLPKVSQMQGKVLLPTGKPLTGGKLVLRPKVRGSQGASAMSTDINKDGTFTIQSQGDEGGNLVATEYKVFISLNGDPKNRGLKRVVPQKYQDVSEEDFETDLFVNLAEQADGIVLKMTKG